MDVGRGGTPAEVWKTPGVIAEGWGRLAFGFIFRGFAEKREERKRKRGENSNLIGERDGINTSDQENPDGY